MRTKTFFLITLFVAMSFILSACGSRSLASTDFPGVSLNGNTAYLAGGAYVYAVDLTTHLEKTTTNSKGEAVPLRFRLSGTGSFFGEPAFTPDGQMVIGDANLSDRKHPIYSVNSQDFSEATPGWALENIVKDTWVAGVLVFNNSIYAPNSDGNLYQFSLDGQLKGHFPTEHALWSPPVTDGKTIFLSSMDHRVYAIDSDLKPIWAQPAQLDASIIGSPAIADGKLYVGTVGGTVYALDAATGSILWEHTVNGIINDHLAVSTDRVFVGTVVDKVGKFYALSMEDGSELWTLDTDSGIVAAPLVKDTAVIFVTENGTVRAVDLEGKALWQYVFDSKLNVKLYSNPVDAGDVILIAPFGKSDMMLVAFDIEGNQKWVFAPSK
jgi:outer membrane protein assembly factor BamB